MDQARPADLVMGERKDLDLAQAREDLRRRP